MFGLLHKISMQVTECDSCQRTNHSIKAPHLPLQPIPITGLWNLWSVDFIGPLTFTPRGNWYIIVATDYTFRNGQKLHYCSALYLASDIITDQGSEFINEVTFNQTQLCQRYMYPQSHTAEDFIPQITLT